MVQREADVHVRYFMHFYHLVYTVYVKKFANVDTYEGNEGRKLIRYCQINALNIALIFRFNIL